MKRVFKTKLNIPLFILLVALLCASTAYAFAALFSSSVTIATQVQVGSVNSIIEGKPNSEFTIDIGESSLAFTQAGQQINFPLTLTNNTDNCYNYFYGISVTSAADGLESAILMYVDGRFVGTLAQVCSNNDTLLGDGYHALDGEYFILPATAASGDVAATSSYSAHNITFELHNATTQSYYSGKSCTVRVCSYAKTINYQEVCFVTNEQQFAYAVNDVNTSQGNIHKTILLGDNITLTQHYTLTQPCTIDLLGNELILGSYNLTYAQEGTSVITSSIATDYQTLTSGSGTIILANELCVLDLRSFYSAADNTVNVGRQYAAIVNVADCTFDAVGAVGLIRQNFYNSIGSGIVSGQSADILGPLYFYVSAGAQVTTQSNDYSYSNGIITAKSNVTSNFPTYIEIGGEKVDFKIFGTGNAAIFADLLNNELSHIPNKVGDSLPDLSCDLFLPTALPEKNIIIEWYTNNEQFIDVNGKLGNLLGEATLTAVVHINNETFNQSFTFRAYGQNNETKFTYLLALLNPLRLKEIYPAEGSEIRLPSADPTSTYYYQTPYVLSDIDSNTYFNWNGAEDIDLATLTYSVSNIYDFITVTSSASNYSAYLNQATFNTHAQIDVTATFENDDNVYTGSLNVVIELGDNADLQELVFTHISTEAAKVNVLNNIISTRVSNGMLYEAGDFTLPDNYMNYEISYSVVATGDGQMFSAVTHDVANKVWIFTVNAEKFNIADTAVPFDCTIEIPDVSLSTQSRTMYVSCPPAIHNDEAGFASEDVFTAVKYQIWQQLPAAERYNVGNASGFTVGTVSGASTLTADVKNYILLRDIGYCNTLIFANSESERTTALLTWAVSTTADVTAASVIGVDRTALATQIDASFADYVNDGNVFLTADEIAAIKAYVNTYYTGTSTQFDTIWNTNWTGGAVNDPDVGWAYTDTGKIITDPIAFNSEFETAIAGGNYKEDDSNTMFKFNEIMEWATYRRTTGGDYGDGKPNNTGYLDSQYHNTMQDTSTTISATEEAVLRNYIQNVSSDTTSANALSAVLDIYLLNCTYFTDEGQRDIIAYVKELDAKEYVELADFTELLAGRSNCLPIPTGYNVPNVVTLDATTTGLSYFTNLTRLSVYGLSNELFPIFSTTNNVRNFFNRLTNYNHNITQLELQYCSTGVTTLDISNVVKLTNLNHLNLLGNSGVSSIGALLNTDIANLDFLDVDGINATIGSLYADFAHMYFVYENANHATISIYYQDNGRKLFSPASADADYNMLLNSLYYLKDLNAIDSEYLQLALKVYSQDGEAHQIDWTIEQGNVISEVELPVTGTTVTTAAAMAQILTDLNNNISVYYSGATQTIDGVTYTQGNFYTLTLNDGTFAYSLNTGRNPARLVATAAEMSQFVQDVNNRLDILYTGTSQGNYIQNTLYSLAFSNGIFTYEPTGIVTVNENNSAALAQVLDTLNAHRVIYYTGSSGDGYTNGSFYELTSNNGIFSYVQSAVLNNATEVTSYIQLDELIDYVNQRINIHYSGATGNSYTKGTVYKLTYDATLRTFSYIAQSGKVTGVIIDDATQMTTFTNDLTCANYAILYTGTSGSYTQNTIYKSTVAQDASVSLVAQTTQVTTASEMLSRLNTANSYLCLYTTTARSATYANTSVALTARTYRHLTPSSNGLLLTLVAISNTSSATTVINNPNTIYRYTGTTTTNSSGTFTRANYYLYDGTTLFDLGTVTASTISSNAALSTRLANLNSYHGSVCQYTGASTADYTQNAYYQLVYNTVSGIFKYEEFNPIFNSINPTMEVAQANQLNYYTGATTTDYTQYTIYDGAWDETTSTFTLEGSPVAFISSLNDITSIVNSANAYYYYFGTTTAEFTNNTIYDVQLNGNSFAFIVTRQNVTAIDNTETISQHLADTNNYYYYGGTFGTYTPNVTYKGTLSNGAFTLTQAYAATTHITLFADMTAAAESAAAAHNAYYYYTGTSGTYTQYSLYLLAFDGTDFGFSLASNSNARLSGAISMDSILADATSRTLNNYYFYTGQTHTSATSGNTYTQYTVYRLVKDNNGNYVYTTNHEYNAQGTQVTSITTFMATPSASTLGRVYQLYDTTGTNLMSYKLYGIFVVAINPDSGAYYLKKIGALSFDSDGTYLRLVNEKYYNAAIHDYEYGGTGGEQVAILTATITTTNADNEVITVTRTFTITVTG